jgi:hypothetical protein
VGVIKINCRWFISSLQVNECFNTLADLSVEKDIKFVEIRDFENSPSAKSKSTETSPLARQANREKEVS